MSEKQLTIFLWVALGVILLGGGLGLYYFQMVWLDDLTVELENVTKEVNIAIQKKADIQVLEKKKKDLDEKIAAITKRIPEFTKSENDAFADLLDRIRKKCRVMMADVKHRPARSTPGASPLPKEILQAKYEFKAAGGFYQLLNFLNHIETDMRLLFADSIKISAGTAAEAKGGQIPPRELVLTVSTFLKRVTAPPGVKPGEPAVKVDEPKDDEVKKLSTPPPD